ncbi:MAG: hypothetical protein OEM52_03180 [bacterium]|nr:hypothetical protein [bacterium]
MRITSISLAILAGGVWHGLPGWRVRTADSEDEAEHNGEVLEAEEIVEQCSGFPGALVDICGGEPMAYGALASVCRELHAANHRVRVHTNGSISLARLPDGVIRRVIWTKPRSNLESSALPSEQVLTELTEDDEMVFRIDSRSSFQYALERIRSHRLTRHAKVEMIAVDELPRPQLGNWILETGLPIRLGDD